MTCRVSIWADPDRRRRLGLALVVFGVFTLGAFLAAPPELFRAHTPFNHFALLAEAWLSGRLHLEGGPPVYAGNNDFAWFQGRTYVVFPPFPAVLLLPLVLVGGSAESVHDGLFFLILSGIGPALLFLVLEKLRQNAESARSQRENLALALVFGFGSVYFFSAVQGTVWFAAHVVAVALCAGYVLCALGAERPLFAGTLLGLAFMTRAPLIGALPLFVYEAFRRSAPPDAPCPLRQPAAYFERLDRAALFRSLGSFALPLSLILGIALIYNRARFGEFFEFGYRYLEIAWRPRIEKWGLFSYHYLAKNLGVMLTSLPWVPGANAAPFSINHHGLALWVTTPLYLLLFWKRRSAPIYAAFLASAFSVALPSLFYQNTGWLQFGYRFSNDYAVFLWAAFALTGWRLRRGVLLLVSWALLVNLFGALTFGRAEFAHFYFTDRSQRILYQPD